MTRRVRREAWSVLAEMKVWYGRGKYTRVGNLALGACPTGATTNHNAQSEFEEQSPNGSCVVSSCSGLLRHCISYFDRFYVQLRMPIIQELIHVHAQSAF